MKDFFTKQFIAFKGLLKYFVLIRAGISQDFTSKIIPSTVSACLQLYGLGKILGPTISIGLPASFILFILPGYICLNVINSSFNEGALESFLLFFDKTKSQIVTSPATNYVYILALICSAFIRSLFTSTILCIFTYFCCDKYTIHNPFLLLFLSFICAVIMSCVGIIQGLNSKTFSQVFATVPAILGVLATFSGQIFSIDFVKNDYFLYTITVLNPLYYLVDSFRYAFIGVCSTNIGLSITIFILITILAVIICIQQCNIKLKF